MLLTYRFIDSNHEVELEVEDLAAARRKLAGSEGLLEYAELTDDDGATVAEHGDLI